MRKQIAIAVMAAALLLGGCATGYQSADGWSFNGGYSEIRLAPDSWRVLVEGNPFTSRTDADAILMRRSAELALEQGMRYFVFEDKDAWMRATRDEEGDVTFSPVTEAVVVALKQNDGRAFDAIKVIQETDVYAKGKLSERAKATIVAMTDVNS